MRRRVWEIGWRRAFIMVAAMPLLCLGWVIGDTFIEHDNFRVVTPDLFRSGQLRSDEWDESLAQYGYKSVLNLRGAKPGQGWYDLEQRFASAHGLTHYDHQLAADISPSVADMDRLVDIMRTAPKPLLIHCKDGADRSGLVAALYRLSVERAGLSEAQAQLSLWYGHFPWLTSKTGAMDRALATFVACASAPNRSASCESTGRAAATSRAIESGRNS